jgi:hypothetical protein
MSTQPTRNDMQTVSGLLKVCSGVRLTHASFIVHLLCTALRICNNSRLVQCLVGTVIFESRQPRYLYAATVDCENLIMLTMEISGMSHGHVSSRS